jgi:tetratricopeptide (TPR) repeat protein
MKRASFRKLSVSLALLVFVFQFGTASAQKGDIFNVKSGGSSTHYYTPFLMKSLGEARQELRAAFTRKYPRVFVYDWESLGALHHLKIKDVQVFDDRLEFILKKGDKRTLYFSKLFGNRLILFSKTIALPFGYTYKENISYDKSNYYVLSGNNKKQNDTLSIFVPISITRKEYTIANHLPYVDAFYTIQQHMISQHRDSLLQAFKSVAEKYRALTVKPTMSEEQRKYVVQANYYTNQKKYPQAINLYQKVIKLNRTSYPTAYNNLALLYAQVNQFPLAIYYMRHYLLLEPDGKEARAAQDKIYEWELKVKPLL